VGCKNRNQQRAKSKDYSFHHSFHFSRNARSWVLSLEQENYRSNSILIAQRAAFTVDYPTMQIFSGATAITSCEDQKRTEGFNALRYRERLIA
jgi:hypothetical protein